MVLSQLSVFFKQNAYSGTVIFSIFLVILEKVVEENFVCPCEKIYMKAFFWCYLLVPMFTAFVFGLYLLRFECYGSGQCNEKCWANFKKFLACTLPSFVWLAMFFCDGRYLACLETALKTIHADSEGNSKWEWCTKKRNLTKEQYLAEKSFFISKITGFGVLSGISLIAFGYKIFWRCSKCFKKCSECCSCNQCFNCCICQDVTEEYPCCSAYHQSCGSSHCKDCCTEHNRDCCSDHRNTKCLVHLKQKQNSTNHQDQNPSEGTGSTSRQDQNPSEGTGSTSRQDQNPSEGTGSTSCQDQNPSEGTGSATGQDQNPSEGTGSATGQDQNPSEGTGSTSRQDQNPSEGTGSTSRQDQNPSEGTGSTTGQDQNSAERKESKYFHQACKKNEHCLCLCHISCNCKCHKSIP